MLEDLREEAGKVGLKIHSGKTKLLKNNAARRSQEEGKQKNVQLHGGEREPATDMAFAHPAGGGRLGACHQSIPTREPLLSSLETH